MEEYLKSVGNNLVLIMIGAEWCNPCNNMKPNFISMSNMEKYKSFSFYILDIDKDYEVCNELEITKLPTFIYFKNMKEVIRDNTIKTLLDLNKFIMKLN